MPSRNPKVAIIMRSYNDRSVIRQTLEMLEKQTYRDYQLWNFDSTSSDGTLEIIREFNHPDRIRLNCSTVCNNLSHSGTPHLGKRLKMMSMHPGLLYNQPTAWLLEGLNPEQSLLDSCL